MRAKAGSLVVLYLGALSLCVVAPSSPCEEVCVLLRCGDGITKGNQGV